MHRERRQWRTERGEPSIDPLGVFIVGPDQCVEVFRSAGMTVVRDSVTTDDRKGGAGVVELDQEIAKIVRELDHRSRQRTKRIGVSALSYAGNLRPAIDQLARVSWCTSETPSSPRTGTMSCSTRARWVLSKVAVARRASARERRSLSASMLEG